MNWRMIVLSLFVLAGPALGSNVSIISSFPGASGPGYKDVPDCTFGVGPNHVMEFDGLTVVIHDKTNGSVLQSMTQAQFWANAHPGFTMKPNDPRILYDPLSLRWFAVVQDVSVTGGRGIMAVSTSSDPTQAWNGIVIPTPPVDIGMKLGVDKNGVYITFTNQNTSTNIMMDAFAIPKADAISPAGPDLSHLQHFTNLQLEAFPATDLDPTKAANAPEVLLNHEFPVSNNQFSRLFMYKITWSGNTATITSAQTITLSTTYYCPNNNGQNVIVQPSPGTPTRADEPRRTQSVFAHGGSVFTCNEAKRTLSTNPGIFWAEIRISDGAILQEALVDDSVSSYDSPSLAVDSSGNIGLGCTRASASEFPSVYVMAHAAGDPAGFMGPPVLAVAGTTYYRDSLKSPHGWGNYTTTCMDPVNPANFWTYQEYANSTVDQQWCTAVVQFKYSSGSISTSTALASSLNPSTYGQAVTLTATVSPGTATGTVTFRDGSTILGTGTVVGGVATFTTTALTAGSHSITAVYGGDLNFSGSTSSVLTQSVNKAASAITVSSSINPSNVGQTVTYTVTVSPKTATGIVTFKDGSSTTLGTGALSGGVATFTTAALAVGSHSITAVYGGDPDFTGSVSAILTQVVTNGLTATTTTIASSLNPSAVGQGVTFTATVSPGAASGTVTFKDGSTILGTGSLINGITTFNTTAMSAGSHSITAVYGGDPNNLGSTSGTLTQKVNAPLTITSGPTATPNPAAIGQNVNFVVSATAPNGDPLTYAWTFGDGGAGTGMAASHAFTAGGVYTVQVVVADTVTNLSTSGSIPVTISTATDPSLVGYWTLDELSGNIAHDSSGNGNDGILVNSPVWTAGKINDALSFNGINSYVNVPDSTSLNTGGQITLAAWINSRNPGSATPQEIIAKNDDIHQQYSIRIFAGKITFRFNGQSYSGNTVLSANTWYRIVGTCDGTSMNIYVNGALDISQPVNHPLGTDNGLPVTIGAWSKPGKPFVFNGLIDDARIYNRALSLTELQGLPSLASAATQLPPSAAGVLPIGNVKLQAHADFKHSNKDVAILSAEISTPTQLALSGQKLAVSIGGATAEFDLDDKGRAKSAVGSVALSQIKKTRGKSAGNIALKVKLTGGSWGTDAWGLNTDSNHGIERIPITISVQLGAFLYEADTTVDTSTFK
jgi:hypothetical protein